MKRSEGRILTTHAGSLPRGAELLRLMIALSKREPVDAGALEREIAGALRHVVDRQLEVGIDVGNDGEQSRESFFTYVQHRLSGFAGESDRPIMRDLVAFPSFVASKMPDLIGKPMVSLIRAPKAVGEVRHLGLGPLERELDAFAQALGDRAFEESFWTAATPGIVACAMLDEHHGSYERYVTALADALRPEYAAIVARGYVLQLDAPDLAMERHTSYADRPIDDFLAFVETNVAAINRATEGLPADRIRLHVCWGNYEGPHHLDVPMREILAVVHRARVGAISLPFANPRHEHEWRVLEELPPPDGRLVVAGVIDTTTNYVEHPEVVADRIERVARALGDPTRVLAGTDCGFGTAAGLGEVAEEVVWEKLAALRAGAELASRRLFRA
ncbi:MAG: cobalamin-independent methionine synthase II family protein [Candidatus Binatia bacterium]